MEDIYTIKVKTNPNPSNLYPSERRYSASTVLGLGVVHLALGLTAFLLALLTLIAKNDQLNLEHSENMERNHIETIPVHLTLEDLQNPEISRKIEMFSRTNVFIKRSDNTSTFDSDPANETVSIDSERNITEISSKHISSPMPSLTLAPCLISLGALAAGITGILAWRRWYIDHNIMWFFISSIVSTAVSVICFITILVGVAQITRLHFSDYYASSPRSFVLRSENGVEVLRSISSDETTSEDPSNYNYYERRNENLRVVLAINIAIAAFLELIWSVLSSRIAWRGMRNGYPDDVNVRRSGHMQVNTVYKGNNAGRRKIVPKPDIIAHYPKKGKMAKYFPRDEVNKDNLPNAESYKEYQERVHKFLTSAEENISQ